MPLILFCGYPNSGKSDCVNSLKEVLETKLDESPFKNIEILSDETIGIKHEQYNSSIGEKQAVAALLASVKRHLNKSTILIVDTMSYNRGFRYQLFCESKALSTPHVVIHVVSQSGYNDKTYWDINLQNALIARFEEPDPAKRWDSPLLTLSNRDDIPSITDELWTILLGKTRRRIEASNATKGFHNTTNLSANYVQILDQETQSVIKDMLSSDSSDSTSSTTNISPATLQRHRRAFVSLQRVRPVDVDRIKPLFLEYLEKALDL